MSLQTKTGKFQFRLQVTGCNKHMSHIRQHTPTAHRIHTDETWMTPRSWFTVHSQDNKPQTHLSTHQISRKQSHTQPSCAAAAFTTIRHWNVSRRDRCINWVLVFDLQGNVLTHSNALKSFGTEMCTANHWLTCCTNYQNRLRCAEVIDINFLPRFCGLVVGMSKQSEVWDSPVLWLVHGNVRSLTSPTVKRYITTVDIQPNTGGIVHELASISTATESGRTRTMFPGRPPPVIWAAAFTSPDLNTVRVLLT